MDEKRETSQRIARLTKELAKAKAIALDTMIFSYQYFGQPKLKPLTEVIFNHIESGKVKGYASWLSVGELSVEIQNAGSASDVKTYIDFISSFPNLILLPAEKNVIEHFVSIRLNTHLETADSLHIASAQTANADLLISNDSAWRNRFAKPKLILLSDYLK